MDPDQTAPIGAVCSGSTLFASKPNSSVMLGNHLQQTTSADDIFRVKCINGLQKTNSRMQSQFLCYWHRVKHTKSGVLL